MPGQDHRIHDLSPAAKAAQEAFLEKAGFKAPETLESTHTEQQLSKQINALQEEHSKLNREHKNAIILGKIKAVEELMEILETKRAFLQDQLEMPLRARDIY